MFNKMLLDRKKPSYLTRYGFTYQTSGMDGNLMDTENYITKATNQNETISTFAVDDVGATYKIEYFIDTTYAEPAEDGRIYAVHIFFYDENAETISDYISYINGGIIVLKGKKVYGAREFTCPEGTAKIRVTTNRYPSATADYNKVIYTAMQLYKLDTAAPTPGNIVNLNSAVCAGRYYIEYDGAKYEFSLPEFNGIDSLRDIFYFDKKKKSAFAVKYVNKVTINSAPTGIGLTASSWQRDGYTSFYIAQALPDCVKVHGQKALFSCLQNGKWSWSGLEDGNYGYAYNENFYAIIDNSYTGITEGDTDDEKKAKIKTWLEENGVCVTYRLESPVKIPIPLTKVQTTTAAKLDIWEE